MEANLNINGKMFELVRVQRGGTTGVYKCRNEYLRIGETVKIKRDLDFHKKMETFKFPIAKLVSEGEFGGKYYFIEQSLGEKHLGEQFAEDLINLEVISDEHFKIFLEIALHFAKAQLNTATEYKDMESFKYGIHLEVLCAELPQYKSKILNCFEEVTKRLLVFPFVITHGDFNPHNLYPKGAIDLADSFYGPFGFDLVTAIVHVNYFPTSGDYEYVTHYTFTSEQEAEYFRKMDSITAKAGLPALSDFKSDFEFCRGLWSLSNMQKWPKIQKWRYDLFISKFLS